MWMESRMGRSIWPNGLEVEGGDLIWFLSHNTVIACPFNPFMFITNVAEGEDKRPRRSVCESSGTHFLITHVERTSDGRSVM